MSFSNTSMPHFELHRLSARDDASLLDEIRRVSELIPGAKLSRVQFNGLSRVHSSTLEKRFGSWRKALEAAGLALRSDTSNLRRSPEGVVKELKRVAAIVGTSELTKALFEQHANFKFRSVIAPFGTWSNALKAAGLVQAKLGKRYSDEECFENLLAVWTQLGRPPKHSEMTAPPSIVGPKAYVLRWGTWLRALEAFVERANKPESLITPVNTLAHSEPTTVVAPSQTDRGSRDIPLSLRYKVLVRD